MFDILIIGGGPAGISAGIYAKRANQKVAIIEKFIPGGQVSLIGEIENYPGFDKINGADLSMKFANQVANLGVDIIYDEAVKISVKGNVKKVFGKNGTYETRSIIFAMGSASKELNVDGEKKFLGKGVSYCAMCDGNFYKGKEVAVVGSGDSAVSNVMYLSGICSKVKVFVKKDFKLNAYKEEDVSKIKNVEIYKNSEITKITGTDKVSEVEFIVDNENKKIKIDGLFVAIGRTPDTEFLKGKIKLDSKGYIITHDIVKTNIDGVFACGDVRNGNLKQIVVSAGEGAVAGTEAIKYVLAQKLLEKK